MNRDFILPGGGAGSEFISVYVSDTSGQSASLTAVHLKNGKIKDTKVIGYLSAYEPVNFGFVIIQFVPPNWIVTTSASEVYNASSFPAYTGFKTRGEELYSGAYTASNGNAVAAVLTKG